MKLICISYGKGSLLMFPKSAKTALFASVWYYASAKKQMITVFDLITTYTPISTESSNAVVFRIQPVYFLSISL